MWEIRLFAVVVLVLSGDVLRARAMFPGTKPKSWSFEPLSLRSESSDESKFKCDLKVERIKGREMGLGGVCNIIYDVNAPTVQIEGKSFRSETGKEDDYKPLPFVVKKGTVEEFLNGFYKQIMMETIDGCSNFPVFKDKFTPPFKSGTYTLNKCKLSLESMPDHMRPGFYKVKLIGSGDVDWLIEIGVKIEEAPE